MPWGCCKARAGPEVQPVLSPPGSVLWVQVLQHNGMPRATAELQERREDTAKLGC